MILTPEELQWATDRMKIYDIKYQEIYYELFDHVITAIKAKRIKGTGLCPRLCWYWYFLRC
ncbi:hypothetical protein ABIB62_001728 [Mucilaginibacter sp. UYP25]|uniref:hypothetical protein n=1 Tax=unclassified Mucilaginibacter TaxID=2617802 RepID=UPI00339A92EA